MEYYFSNLNLEINSGVQNVKCKTTIRQFEMYENEEEKKL